MHSLERAKDITTDLASGDVDFLAKKSTDNSYDFVPRAFCVHDSGASGIANITLVPSSQGENQSVLMQVNKNEMYYVAARKILQSGTVSGVGITIVVYGE